MNNYFLGSDKERILGDSPTFFYAIRRTDDGELYFTKVNQLNTEEVIQINAPGDVNDDYTDFEIGEDFFEGRDVYHNLVYDNLNYEQYKWDNRNLFYYINSEGELVVRIGKTYQYNTPDNV